MSFITWSFVCVFLSKRIRSTVDEKEQKQLLMDLDVVMRSSDCPYIVQFYGALFREVKMKLDYYDYIFKSFYQIQSFIYPLYISFIAG